MQIVVSIIYIPTDSRGVWCVLVNMPLLGLPERYQEL